MHRLLSHISFNVLIIVAGSLLLQACGGEESGPAKPEATAVKTLTLTRRSVPIAIQYPGRAEGSKEVQVRARVEGILLSREYKEGASVEADQLLFQIDDAPFRVDLERAKAQLAQANAALSAAQRRWDRASELIKRDAISRRERDDALSDLEAAQATVQLQKAEVKSAQIDLDYTQVKAPISGITSREEVSEGSLVGPSNSLLTRITQLDPIWVNISMPDSALLNFRSMLKRDELRFHDENRKVRVESGQGEEHGYTGAINFTESAVDRQTGTVQLRASLPNPQGTLLPGQFVRVFLEGIEGVNALTIPEQAIMQNAQGSYVYRINDEGNAETALVSLGLKSEQGMIVTSGLEAGDRIIVEGLGRVRPGMPVKAAEQEKNKSQQAPVAQKSNKQEQGKQKPTSTSDDTEQQDKPSQPNNTASEAK
jgi:membrane fusion protein (multidrug efflux system)